MVLGTVLSSPFHPVPSEPPQGARSQPSCWNGGQRLPLCLLSAPFPSHGALHPHLFGVFLLLQALLMANLVRIQLDPRSAAGRQEELDPATSLGGPRHVPVPVPLQFLAPRGAKCPRCPEQEGQGSIWWDGRSPNLGWDGWVIPPRTCEGQGWGYNYGTAHGEQKELVLDHRI